MNTLGVLSECGHCCNRKPHLTHKIGYGWTISCPLCDNGQGLFYSKREICVNEWNRKQKQITLRET